MAAVVVVLVAAAVTSVSLSQTPTYEASAQVWVDQEQGTRGLAGTAEGFQVIMLEMEAATDSRPVAAEAIGRLGLEMNPAELLDDLAIEQVESTSFIVLTYEGNDPVEATQIVNTVGEVSSELISESSARSPGSQLRATVYEEAMVPTTPVSPTPLRNGLLTLVVGLALIGVWAIVRGLRRSQP